MCNWGVFLKGKPNQRSVRTQLYYSKPGRPHRYTRVDSEQVVCYSIDMDYKPKPKPGQRWLRLSKDFPETFEEFVILTTGQVRCVDAGGFWRGTKGWTSSRDGIEADGYNQYYQIDKPYRTHIPPGHPAFAAGWQKWGGPK